MGHMAWSMASHKAESEVPLGALSSTDVGLDYAKLWNFRRNQRLSRIAGQHGYHSSLLFPSLGLLHGRQKDTDDLSLRDFLCVRDLTV